MNSKASWHESLQLENGGVVSIVGAGGKTGIMFGLARELAARGENVLTTTTTRILSPSKDCGGHLVLSSSADEILKRSERALKLRRHITAASHLVPGTKNKLAGFSPKTIDRFHASGIFRWIVAEADGAAQKPLKAPAPHEPAVPSGTAWMIGVVGLDCVGKRLSAENVFRSELFSKMTGIPEGRPVTAESVGRAAVHRHGVMKGSPKSAKRILFLNKADIPEGIKYARDILESVKRLNSGIIDRVIFGKAQSRFPILSTYDMP